MKKALVTSSYVSAVDKVLLKANTSSNRLFDFFIGKEVHATKTQKINSVLQKLLISNEEAVYVGDMVSDILYCKKVPVKIGVVTYGFHPEEFLRKHEPDYIIKSQEDFRRFIKNAGSNNGYGLHK